MEEGVRGMVGRRTAEVPARAGAAAWRCGSEPGRCIVEEEKSFVSIVLRKKTIGWALAQQRIPWVSTHPAPTRLAYRTS
jgi:hypothetical protein